MPLSGAFQVPRSEPRTRSALMLGQTRSAINFPERASGWFHDCFAGSAPPHGLRGRCSNTSPGSFSIGMPDACDNFSASTGLSALSFEHTRRSPSQHHGSPLPEFHSPTDVAHSAEQVLDQVGRGQHSLQARWQPEPHHGERLIQPFAQRDRRTGMLRGELAHQVLEQPTGMLRTTGSVALVHALRTWARNDSGERGCVTSTISALSTIM